MKSLVPAALVVILEAGFIFSIAVLPEEHLAVTVQVAAPRQAAATARHQAPASRAVRSVQAEKQAASPAARRS